MRWKSALCAATIALFALYAYKKLNTTASRLTETETCPLCFGQDLCEAFEGDRIKLKANDGGGGGGGFAGWLLNAFNAKNVYAAEFEWEQVVLKRLGSARELRAFDENFSLQDLQEASPSADDLKIMLLKYLSSEERDHVRSLKLCTVEDADAFLNALIARRKSVDSDTDLLANLWTIVHVNPEPLILQLLQTESEQWPVPRYLGACGRVVVERHCGSDLNRFQASPWHFRANLALQLLKAARNFTFDHLEFRFYLTDVSPDNICVDTDDGNTADVKLKFVDLENLILTRRSESYEDVSKIERFHRSADIDCEDCFAYSEADICAHQVSDHNFYAVCKLLLSENAPWPMFENGLLHSPPANLLPNYTYISDLIEACVQPRDNVSRFVIAEELSNALDVIIGNE